MILRGLTASPPVQGVTVQDPVDTTGPIGFSPAGMGGWWTALPSPNFAVSALGVLGATGNIDWSAAGYFSFTTTSGTNLTLTFATTATAALAAASQVNSFQLGQVIFIRVTGAGTPTITWPSTVTWVGVTATPTTSASAPLVHTQNFIALVCTGTGSAPTFDGFYVTV
jgi:hypothetical protein